MDLSTHPDAASEGIEVEGLERPFGLEFCGNVPDQQLPVDEKDVRLYATEPVVECVQQGPGMLIVVMGMSPDQRLRHGGPRTPRDHQADDDQSSCN